MESWMKMLFKNIILLSVDVQYKAQSNPTPHTPFLVIPCSSDHPWHHQPSLATAACDGADFMLEPISPKKGYVIEFQQTWI